MPGERTRGLRCRRGARWWRGTPGRDRPLNRKDELERTASVLAAAGMACLLLAIIGAVFVVMDVVTTLAGACAAAGGVGLACVLLWYALPLRHRGS